MNYKNAIKRIIPILLIIFSLKDSYQFSIDNTKSFILDNYGRYSIFHGTNVVIKLPPYLPEFDKFDPYMSLNTEYDLETMKRLGFNNVRLGVMWESVEIQPNVFDYNYLDKVENIINVLGEHGIYTMIDAHEDVFARNFCGEGVPYFYVNEMGYDQKCDESIMTRILGMFGVCKTLSDYNFNYDENGLPLIEDCKKHTFGEYNSLAEVSSANRNFYDNKNGIQDKFVEFWKVVAKRFKGNKYVLGYDFWNEPSPGGALEDIKSFIPGRPDIQRILPLYRKINTALREIDPDFILYFENTPFPDTLPILGGLVWGSMREKPGSDDEPQVYNFHTYCCLAGANVCPHGEAPYSTTLTTCPKYHNNKFKEEIKAAKEYLHTPMFLTEFGACSDSLACYNEIYNVVKLCEENFISWSYWNYKPYGDHTTSAIEMVEYEGIYNDDGTVQNIKERGLSRGYVQYYQGMPIDFKFEENSDTDFETSFEYHSNISEPTVLFYNKDFFYKDGYSLTIINDETKENLLENKSISINEDTPNYIYITGDKSLLEDKTKIRIIFKSKYLD